MATIAQVIQNAYQFGTGKTPLATTDVKYTRLLNLADIFTKEWGNTPGGDWNSLWRITNASATIPQSSSTEAVYANLSKVAMPATIREISQREQDSVILLGTDGKSTWPYDTIDPSQLNQRIGEPVCSVINGQLVFATLFLSGDVRIGATVAIPGYISVTDVTADSQTCQVDDPLWLAYRMAAEFVRTDLVRRDQYPNLLAMANDKMSAMMGNNASQRDEIPVDTDMDFDTNSQASAWY